MECVMWNDALRNGFGELCPTRPGSSAKAVVEFVAEGRDVDSVQQRVSDPVRLDNPMIERIRNPRGSGNQRQIRPRAGKRLRQLEQARIDHTARSILEQHPVIGRSAVAPQIWRVGVPGEHSEP